MISALPPVWAMGGLALHAQADPHIVDGTHYRLVSDPRLGLPMRPIQVWRRDLGKDARHAPSWDVRFPALRDEVVWTDAAGRTLVAPFSVTPDNPVTGVLPTHLISRCVWLKVETTASSNIRAEVFRDTERGPRLLAARDSAPLSLGGDAIDGVIVSGEGVVHDLTWLDVWRLEVVWDEMYEMGLPRDAQPRFDDLAPGSPLLRALQRVHRGAPTHLGLHDEPDAADATSTSPVTALQEDARSAALGLMAADALDALLSDLSAPQHALEQREFLEHGAGSETPEATWKPNELIHTSMHDPTLARALGYMDVELPDEYDPPAEHVVMYQMRSWWSIDPAALTPAELATFLPSLLGLSLTSATADGGPSLEQRPDGLPVFYLWVPAVAVGHTPPLRPAAPVVGPERAPTSPATLDHLGPWLPAQPPAARRQATVDIGGIAPAASLAVAADIDGIVTGLNERVPVVGSIRERALLLVPTVPADASENGTGRFTHRSVPEGGLTLRVAQADSFGRWSDWGVGALAAKERPAPPEPVFDMWYEVADVVGGDGPVWGRLTARVQVPPAVSLAPGSRLLSNVRLEGDIDGSTFAVEAPLSDPTAIELVVEIPPPATSLIGVGHVATATTRAQWFDTAGIASVVSTPRISRCVDARQPAVTAAPPVLDWTAWPDATGRARVKLVWTPGPAQAGFRVYGCDEQRIRHQATERAEQGNTDFENLISLLDGAADRPGRAQVLRDHQALFEPDWFEGLTDAPIGADQVDDDGALSFQHELSGSLGVLAMYKIVAETEGGTPAEFASTPLRVWAVPERSGPPRPMLEVLDAATGWPDTVTLRLRLTGDPGAAVRYRLRRSSVHADPRRMPVARVGAIEVGDAQKFMDIVDDGTFAHDRPGEPSTLRAGTRYSWTVEVQSPDLPGSARPGAWSWPSPSVSTRLSAALSDTALSDTDAVEGRRPVTRSEDAS